MTTPQLSRLKLLVKQACRARDDSVNSQIVNLIKEEKRAAPRVAALAIVEHIKFGTQGVALIAFNLLDLCVEKCGYAFHLQNCSKEFLNKLVYKLPPRAPLLREDPPLNEIQLRILAAIEKWRINIYDPSPFREDFVSVMAMRQLLASKGYSFPRIESANATVLKSAEEMEKEHLEIQDARHFEFLRRASSEPKYIPIVNDIVKDITGYTQSKVDYRAQAAKDVMNIQERTRGFEEMLDKYGPGDRIQDADVLLDWAKELEAARPEIQKIIVKESEDDEAVARLLETNDNINRVLERFELLKKGDFEGAKKLVDSAPAAAPRTNNAPSARELSLIDFEAQSSSTEPAPNSSESVGGSAMDLLFDLEAPVPSAESIANPSGSSLEQNMLGLSMSQDDSTVGQMGQISLGSGASSMMFQPQTTGTSLSSLLSSAPADPFSGIDTRLSKSASSTPAPGAQPLAFAAPRTPTKDPFVALVSNPSQHNSSTPPLAAMGIASVGSTSAQQPPSNAPKEFTTTVQYSDLKVDIVAFRDPNATNALSVAFAFSNTALKPMSKLELQVAVTKDFKLVLKPQSGRSLTPLQSRGITQQMHVWKAGNPEAKVEYAMLRWRVLYNLGESSEVITTPGNTQKISIA